ncbi:MAG: SBBP repeat-containing protein [Candidatus Heimdallarchaeota archaeon]
MFTNHRNLGEKRIRKLTGIIVLIIITTVFCFSSKSLALTETNDDNQKGSISSCAFNELVDFSTYLGGTGDELGVAAQLHFLGETIIDTAGNIIVVGRSASTDFPTLNAYQASNGGSIDATISKFAPNGTLIFSTYLGGSYHDWANCVALDSSNNIIVGGITGSANFPTVNPYQDTLMGGSEGNADIFVAKLSSNGQTLMYSTYFGSTGSDWCYSIACSSSGLIAFTGTTLSTAFPMVNAVQTSKSALTEGYLTVLNADGQSIKFSTYLGSTNYDQGRGVTFDNSGDVLLTGFMGTANHGTDGVFQKNFGGSISDAYLAKFQTNGTMKFFSFLGGSGMERANDIQIDSENNIIITGYTSSENFPTANAYQNELAGNFDVFLTKVNSSGENIIFSTFFGSPGIDDGYGIAIDNKDDILITGETLSTQYPNFYDFNCTGLGNSDGFISKFTKNGTLTFSTIFGGSNMDLGVEIATYGNNQTVVVGFTQSSNLPTHNAYQDSYRGAGDMFLIKLDVIDLDIPIETEPGTPTVANELNTILIIFAIIPCTLINRLKKKRRRS